MGKKKSKTPAASPLQKLVKPYDRILLTKSERGNFWKVTSNPRWDFFNKAMSDMLLNECDEYAETKNCGMMTRMIRVSDLESYGMTIDEIENEWILRRDEAKA